MAEDPYTSFRFRVFFENNNNFENKKKDQNKEAAEVVSFSEVSGLQIEVETESYYEGGVNGFVHIFPKGIKYQPLVLKRGIAGDPEQVDKLRKWYTNVVVHGQITRKKVTVVLIGPDGKDKRSWSFQGAYPVKWKGPELKADSNTIAIESIELVHQGMIDSEKKDLE